MRGRSSVPPDARFAAGLRQGLQAGRDVVASEERLAGFFRLVDGLGDQVERELVVQPVGNRGDVPEGQPRAARLLQPVVRHLKEPALFDSVQQPHNFRLHHLAGRAAAARRELCQREAVGFGVNARRRQLRIQWLLRAFVVYN